MHYILSDELNAIENNIYLEYTNNKNTKGKIKTTLTESPTNKIFLQIKRNLKKRLSNIDKNIYIDNIELNYGKYSKYNKIQENHQWDLVGSVLTLGLLIPLLLPKLITDLHEYYTTEDYNYITFDIETRHSNVDE